MSLHLNKWQRLFVILGSIGFLFWAAYVTQTDDSPHPETSFLAAVLLAVWAGSSKLPGEDWFPGQSKVKRSYVIALLAIPVAVIAALFIIQAVEVERPADEATEMAIEPDYEDLAEPQPAAPPSISPYMAELVEKMQREKAHNDPVADAVNAMRDRRYGDEATADASTSPDSQR